MLVEGSPNMFQFDVFLCHNSKDKAAVREVKELLNERGIDAWLDESELQPGTRWQEAIELGLQQSKTVAVFVAEHGLGDWQDQEMRVCLEEAIRRGMKVIPVLLPGASEQSDLPPFLRSYVWVDLRDGPTSNLDKLVWGITDKEPQSIPPFQDAQAAIVCCSVHNYTALAQNIEWLQRFERFVAPLRETIVKTLEGMATVEFDQDRIRVVFLQDVEINKALNLAFDIKKYFAKEDDLRQANVCPLQTSVAIDYGDVLVRATSSAGKLHAIGAPLVNCSRVQARTLPGMVWSTRAVKAKARAGHRVNGKYQFRKIGWFRFPGTKGEYLYHVVRRDTPEDVYVRQYPRGHDQAVYVYASDVDYCHICWGNSHYVYTDKTPNKVGRTSILFEHRLLKSPLPPLLLRVYVSPNCDVMFFGPPEFKGDHFGSVLTHLEANHVDPDGVTLEDTSDKWYTIPDFRVPRTFTR
jgi:class 3 adenylate cyclase